MEPMLELTALRHRVDRLERQNRHWKVCGGGAGLLLGLIVLAGAAGRDPESIRARELVVVDRNGTIKALLNETGLKFVTAGHTAWLDDWGLTFHKKGRGATKLGAEGLTLHDQSERERVWLTLVANGSPLLSLKGDDEKIRVGLAVLDNVPFLEFYDKTGALRRRLD